MGYEKSIVAVKDAIGNDEFHGSVDVTVVNNGRTYTYKNIYVNVYYNAPYMQMNVDIVWEDDSSQPDYQSLGLHGQYNTNFQTFHYNYGFLSWDDGNNQISVRF